MDPQSVIDVALAAGAANLGAPEAAKIFREQYKTSLRVNVNLTPAQKALLRKIVDFPIVFLGGKSVTNDHPILVACRDLVRDVFEDEFKINTANERTLIVGASSREIRKYNANPHIHYYVHGKENKDYDRIIRPALTDICKCLKKKAAKDNFTVFLEPPQNLDTAKMRPVVKRYWKMQEVLKDYMIAHKMPANIHTTCVEANTLVFEDSFYNFDEYDFVDIFERTKAEIAYGYGLLPLELLFPDMAENPLYQIRIEKTHLGQMAYLTFRNGYCNGYAHSVEKWKTLLKSPVITDRGSPITLAVEITARVGPMVTFKIMRCRNPEMIVRTIELSERQRYVRILDIMECINKRTGKVNDPLVYFSMLESEYLDVLNYLMSLDPKSMTFQNTIAYIRRRMGGMSLITKELVEPWFLTKRKVHAAALTIFLDVKLRGEQRETAIDNIGIGSVWERMLAFLRRIGRKVIFPITMLMDWLLAGHLVDRLVLDGKGEVFQNEYAWARGDMAPEDLNVGLYLDNPYEGDIPSCPVCFELLGKLGQQIVKCEHACTERIDLSLSDEQIGELRNSLIDTDADPPGLAAVKKRCLEHMPTTGFTVKVNMRYIRAGPGCGKSYVIRQLATPNDLVLAPFTKLRPDYVDLKTSDGEKYDLTFKTTHRAMETRGCQRIFVDEFTSMPYEYLACIAYVNGADEVYLVGDEKQTKVQEPTEGMYIGNHIDLTKLSTHTLLVNFRNPKDTVAMLNKVYGYNMYAHSDITRSIEFLTQDELPKDLIAIKMAFSSASAKLYTENEKNTVRANQGGTHKISVVYCTITDGKTPSVEELQIVALSRHTEKLYIVVDGCDEAVKLQQKLALDADFYEHMQTWLTFPNEPTREVIQEDHLVDAIVKAVQPPKDMYLLAETFQPTAAFDDDVTSMNLQSSALVQDGFITGKFDPDLLLMPVNRRGHPISMKMEYYAMGCGIGNYFSNKSPIQVMQVLQARYFNKQVYFECGYKQQLLAAKVVNKWFAEHVQPEFRKNLFDDAEIQEVVCEFMKKVTASSYQQSFAATSRSDNDQGRAIRFHLKGIFKPKHGTPDVDKAGQGISAWSVDACAMFCSIFRILTRLVVKTELPHVITDAYLSELDFIQRVTVALQELPAVAQFATTDGVTFDANQNAFTQLIEKQYWTAYGVPTEFLDHYYSFRKDYRVISSVAVGFAGTQKTSGEPGTLVNNGIVSKIISNYVIVGEGPQVTIYKGDDYSRRQLNLVHDLDKQREINSACSLGLRVAIANSTDFCGLTFAGGKLFPSIQRKVNKITAHRFRTYQHFCEYQDSLRNWIDMVTRLNEMNTVACNAQHYCTTYEEMQDALDFIKSISHINEEQFRSKFKRRAETGLIPVMGSSQMEFVEQVGPADRDSATTSNSRRS